ncbi:hypothetical protein [Fictibacillus terranigra]|uniref:Regulatory protein YrvL n=1 Tax=Fictibacillus terranigra TaxID=3058424 RepID=A0ABT8E4T8_9BACL|nr:hypothetical protein [Fictibacillus sp. CENA-BCM004]MDN4072918.1 hypothetical protein [Fictibacillus sp. CENA-BCM004]
MLKRKLKTALIVSVLMIILMILLSAVVALFYKLSASSGDLSVNIGIYLVMILYVVPIVFLYGIPVSILCDYLTKSVAHNKLFSFGLYVFFGGLFIFVYGLIFLPDFKLIELLKSSMPIFTLSIISSILFWIINEKQK